ncbi:NF038122 family metalloprotease [Sandarakinorhabdus sp. DWP1-3-1]|uniref:NF038122 family metalloprotease n=1 Tax=Sandarakinorhabdus sp. DWP1-3-1 TaxID=2804627 RepID=UPI003CF6AE82
MTLAHFRTAMLAGVLGMSALPATAVTIELRNTGGVEVGTDAYRGFSAAANFWEQILRDDITVKLNVGYAALGPGILGSTGSITNSIFIDSYRSSLAGDRTSALDASAVANFSPLVASTFAPGRGAVDAIISGPKVDGNGVNTSPLTRVWDADGSTNNTGISMNTSLMKAVGLTPTYTGANAAIQADGSISFSTGFASSFDFDPTDGITAGQFDFVAIAIHEIGHALGFRSGVDVYDTNTNFANNLNNFVFMTQLDLFRYSADPLGLGGGGPVLDWGIGGTLVDGYAPYFSIDGGATALFGNTFSTGRTFGDRQQASHWKDAAPGAFQLGLLDPTAARGQQGIITSLDLAAYDAIGWDIKYDVLANSGRYFSTAGIGALPEPGSWAMLIAGFGLTGAVMRRRRAVAA